MTPSEIQELRRTVLSALLSDDPTEDKALFVLPSEDMPLSEAKTRRNLVQSIV